MKRGRPRAYDPSIPRHIDQVKIPRGAYWDRRDHVWYTLIQEGGKQRRQRLASSAATLADLHRLVAELDTSDKGSLEWLHAEFASSDQWKELKPSTQRDYKNCLAAIARVPSSRGLPCSKLIADKLRKVDLQQLVDHIAKKTPSMAAHVLRYLGRLYAWGMQRGRVRERENPAHGLDAPREKKAAKMPGPAIMERTIAFARERGARPPRSAGACPSYLWMVMVLAYRCRLRGTEVLTLTDDNATPEGIRTNRLKGSRDNVVRWSPELREAWAAAVARRDALWRARSMPTPYRPEDRVLIVGEEGQPLVELNAKGELETRYSWNSAWQRFMKLAVSEGPEKGGIDAADRFTLHGLKHRGITDSTGDKQKASGHVAAQMLHRYDHELPVVDPAGAPARA